MDLNIRTGGTKVLVYFSYNDPPPPPVSFFVFFHFSHTFSFFFFFPFSFFFSKSDILSPATFIKPVIESMLGQAIPKLMQLYEPFLKPVLSNEVAGELAGKGNEGVKPPIPTFTMVRSTGKGKFFVVCCCFWALISLPLSQHYNHFVFNLYFLSLSLSLSLTGNNSTKTQQTHTLHSARRMQQRIQQQPVK